MNSMDKDNPPFPPDGQGKDAPATRRASTGKLRRSILIVLACMVVFTAVAIPLVNYIEREDTLEVMTFPDAKYNFAEPDYDYDIMKDKDYLSLNRVVMYENPAQNFSTSLDSGNMEEFGEAVTVLYNMIRRIIQGDTDGYNRLFTNAYRKANGEQERFAMQQLYDIVLTRSNTEQVTENGAIVTYQTFYVRYKIRLNNGTFRTDIGDDECRPQIVVLCNRDDGKMLIDRFDKVYLSQNKH